MHEAKSQLSRLIALVERGEEVVIARHGEPVARLLPADPLGRREPGSGRGTVHWLDEDFELDADELDAFEAPLER
ncbi:MAG: type II toxin-antitoxin system prevent-host-death family antitoxin [Acidimicrobiia bacterium]|nr:type II toxin-antitoxin system prevent-host-death family antitoxin [Acidimicrobiia bacterium]